MGTPNEYLLFPSSIDNLCVKVWSIEWWLVRGNEPAIQRHTDENQTLEHQTQITPKITPISKYLH